jgi:hypothetical protein
MPALWERRGARRPYMPGSARAAPSSWRPHSNAPCPKTGAGALLGRLCGWKSEANSMRSRVSSAYRASPLPFPRTPPA